MESVAVRYVQQTRRCIHTCINSFSTGIIIHLSKFSNLFGQTPHRRIWDVPWILHGHVEHQWVHFSRQLSHNCQSGHVQCHSWALFQFALVYLCTTPNWYNYVYRSYRFTLYTLLLIIIIMYQQNNIGMSGIEREGNKSEETNSQLYLDHVCHKYCNLIG